MVTMEKIMGQQWHKAKIEDKPNVDPWCSYVVVNANYCTLVLCDVFQDVATGALRFEPVKISELKDISL